MLNIGEIVAKLHEVARKIYDDKVADEVRHLADELAIEENKVKRILYSKEK